jgi:hypothetical protein
VPNIILRKEGITNDHKNDREYFRVMGMTLDVSSQMVSQVNVPVVCFHTFEAGALMASLRPVRQGSLPNLLLITCGL